MMHFWMGTRDFFNTGSSSIPGGILASPSKGSGSEGAYEGRSLDATILFGVVRLALFSEYVFEFLSLVTLVVF